MMYLGILKALVIPKRYNSASRVHSINWNRHACVWSEKAPRNDKNFAYAMYTVIVDLTLPYVLIYPQQEYTNRETT